jgi:hypothetical protein
VAHLDATARRAETASDRWLPFRVRRARRRECGVGEHEPLLEHDYRTGTSRTPTIVAIALTALLLLGLVVVQLFVFRRTNRIVNTGLLSATVLIALAACAVTAFTVGGQNQLVRGQREGSDHIQVLAAARILSLRMQSASTLAVIDREPDASVIALADEVGGSNGLIAEESLLTRTGPDTVTPHLVDSFTRYRRTLVAVQDALERRDFPTAESNVLSDQADRAGTLDARLRDAIIDALARLETATKSTRRWFLAMIVGLALTAIAAVFLLLYGLQRRIAEYA